MHRAHTKSSTGACGKKHPLQFPVESGDTQGAASVKLLMTVTVRICKGQ